MSIPFLLVCAMCLDAALGEPEWLWSRIRHPAVVIGNAIGWLDNRLNHGAARRAKGVCTLILLVVAALGVGWVLAQLGGVVEILVCAILLAQKSLVTHVRAVGEGLRASLADGRAQVAMIVSRDTSDIW